MYLPLVFSVFPAFKTVFSFKLWRVKRSFDFFDS
jgi:hypothetical protein